MAGVIGIAQFKAWIAGAFVREKARILRHGGEIFPIPLHKSSVNQNDNQHSHCLVTAAQRRDLDWVGDTG
jgi:hypothetical protein